MNVSVVIKPRLNWQAIISVAVMLVVAFLVVLPMVFLVEESLNVGDPMAFPRQEYGIKNYIAMFDEDFNVLVNTVGPGTPILGGFEQLDDPFARLVHRPAL